MIAQLRKQLVQHGPSLLRVPAKLTPFSLQKKVMLDGLAMVFKEALEDGDFEFLEDRSYQPLLRYLKPLFALYLVRTKKGL